MLNPSASLHSAQATLPSTTTMEFCIYDWNKVLKAPVPATMSMYEELRKLVEAHKPDGLDDQIEQTIDRIDALVGSALGLSAEEIEFIRLDMTEDPFLSQITPRYPFFRPQQRGRRNALSRSDRYARGHAEHETPPE